MDENNQVTGNQEPQYTAPQEPSQPQAADQQPVYAQQQPQYTAPQAPYQQPVYTQQPTYPQQPQYTAPQAPNQQPTYPQQPQYTAPQQPTYPQQPQYTAPQAPNQQPPYAQQPQQPNPQYVNQQPYNAQPQAPYYAAATDNSKAYCILSYIPILWLIGLLGDQKNNPRVRFHVNQGIILTICWAVLGVVSWIIRAIIGAIFRVDYFYGYYSSVSTPGLYLQGVISFIVWAAFTALAVIGIVHVVQNKDQPLPIIGKLFRIVK